MPSSISFNGVRTFRPGVYAVIDASALGGSGISTGNVAIVGDFPSLEQNVPKSFSSARAMSDYFLGDPNMLLLAKIAFSPSSDDRVGGGASILTLVNAGVSTQASGDLGPVQIRSKLFGTEGNKVSFDIRFTAPGSEAFDIIVRKGSVVENYPAISSGELFTAQWSGDGVGKLTVSENSFTLTESFQTADNANEQAVATTFSLPAPRTIKVTGAAAYANDHTITISGTDADGAAQSEAVVIAAGSTTASSTKTFGSVATSTKAASGQGESTVFTISADLLDLNTEDFASLAQILDALNSLPNLEIVKIAPGLGSIPANEMDAQSSVITAATAFHALIFTVVRELGTSQIITASRTNRLDPASALTANGFLSGGTQAVPDTAGYKAALEKLLSEDVQIVTALDDTLAVHKEVLSHCKDAQLYGRERCGYAGAAPNEDIAALSVRSGQLNSRHMALVGQSILYTLPDGTSKTLDPKFFALMVACMQAGTPVATPLTRKRPDILGCEQNPSWNLVTSANDVLSKGILALSLDSLGLRIERSITTYQTDDNPIFSEVSANESVNASVRTLRARLASQIGNPAIAGTRAKIQSSVRINLAKQVKDGVIKAFQNVVIDDMGDRFDISYEVAAVEPLNFIKITANVVRIPG